MVHIGNDWDDILREAFASPWYNELRDFLKEEYSRFTVYPDMHDIFNALKATPYAAVKAVILGQDPYHNPLEAHGMCFSVKPGVRIPPSLQNIYKEKDPGMISISPSVWMDCGAVLLILSDENKLTSDQVSFLEDLSDLCQTYVEVFSSEGQTIDEFEYYLYELEEKLEVLLQPMRYLLNN